MNESCVFCEIVERKAPASIVYEDDIVLAFMSIGPVNPGHLLVIPKRHYELMEDMDEHTGKHLFGVCMRMNSAIRMSGLKSEGANLFLADGEAAFQEVPHVHMHVLPRFKGDKFKVDADWSVKPSREELDDIANRIRLALT
jgi:histidine triad (HIT) family protein